jgi:hypothetical protein
MSRAHAARFYMAVAAGVLAVTAVVVLRERPRGAPSAAAANERTDAGVVD